MVNINHKAQWDHIFKIPGFFQGPHLMFGYQDMTPNMYSPLKVRDFKYYLTRKGVTDITTLDWDDPRADVHHDMNLPFTGELKNKKFKVVSDIGCLEHVLNTKQCLQNCLEAVEVGGLYLLHTPVHGYHKHGLHVFNPDMLRAVLQKNGFELIMDGLSTKKGVPRQEISKREGAKYEIADNIILWLVGRKVRENDGFSIPIDNHGKFEFKTYKT